MKAILISTHPEGVAKTLNGEKSIEIRRYAPKCDLPIEVYIYCTTLQRKHGVWNACLKHAFDGVWRVGNFLGSNENEPVNGKVVAKFTLRKVEEERPFFHWCIEKETCLTRDEVLDYLDSKDRNNWNPKRQGGKVYAWHISDLVIFDKPKDVSEFGLKKAPQSWQYVE